MLNASPLLSAHSRTGTSYRRRGRKRKCHNVRLRPSCFSFFLTRPRSGSVAHQHRFRRASSCHLAHSHSNSFVPRNATARDTAPSPPPPATHTRATFLSCPPFPHSPDPTHQTHAHLNTKRCLCTNVVCPVHSERIKKLCFTYSCSWARV